MGFRAWLRHCMRESPFGARSNDLSRSPFEPSVCITTERAKAMRPGTEGRFRHKIAQRCRNILQGAARKNEPRQRQWWVSFCFAKARGAQAPSKRLLAARLKASAKTFICFTMAARPFARLALRWVFNPSSSMKAGSASRISWAALVVDAH